MATIIVKRGKRRFISQIMVNGVKRAKLFPDTSMESKRAATHWELETKKLLEQESTATRCLSIIVWINEYLDEVQARFSQKTYDEKRKAFSRFKNTAVIQWKLRLKKLNGMRSAGFSVTCPKRSAVTRPTRHERIEELLGTGGNATSKAGPICPTIF